MRTQNLEWLGRPSLLQLQANELADEQAEEGFCSSSKCRASRPKLQCKGLFLGMVGAHVQLRSWCDVAPRVQWQRRTLPESWWSSNASRGGREPHAGEDGQVLVLLEMRVLHRTTGERVCGTVSRNRARPGRSTPEAQGCQACGGPGGRGPGGGD